MCLSFLGAVKYSVTDKQLDTMISNEHINEISLFLVRWEDVAHQLNVDRLKITEIQQAASELSTRNHKVLETWKTAMFRAATYKRLVEVLDKLKEVECADNVCELIREDKTS